VVIERMELLAAGMESLAFYGSQAVVNATENARDECLGGTSDSMSL